MNNAARILKNTLMLFFGRLSMMGFSFIFSVYAARELGVAEFGRYMLLRGYFDLFLALAGGALSNVVIQRISKARDEGNKYIVSAMILTLFFLIPAGAVMFGVSRLTSYTSDTYTALFLVFLSLIPAGLCLQLEYGFLAFEKGGYITSGIIVENMIRTGVSILLIYLGYGLIPLYLAFLAARVANLVIYAAIWHLRVMKFSWYFDFQFLKYLFKEWRVFAAESWIYSIQSNTTEIILSIFVSDTAVGLYSVGGRLLTLAIAISTSYTRAVFPYLTQLYQESEDRLWFFLKRSLKYTMVIVVPVVTCAAAFGDWIIILLYSDEYRGGVPIFRVLLWLIAARYLTQFLSYSLFAQDKQVKSLYTSSITLVFFLPVSVILVESLGALGMAWARLLTQALAVILYLYYSTTRDQVFSFYYILAKIGVAGAAFGGFLILADVIHPIPRTILGGIIYVLVILALRVFSPKDISLMQDMSRTAWRRLRLARQ